MDSRFNPSQPPPSWITAPPNVGFSGSHAGVQGQVQNLASQMIPGQMIPGQAGQMYVQQFSGQYPPMTLPSMPSSVLMPPPPYGQSNLPQALQPGSLSKPGSQPPSASDIQTAYASIPQSPLGMPPNVPPPGWPANLPQHALPQAGTSVAHVANTGVNYAQLTNPGAGSQQGLINYSAPVTQQSFASLPTQHSTLLYQNSSQPSITVSSSVALSPPIQQMAPPGYAVNAYNSLQASAQNIDTLTAHPLYSQQPAYSPLTLTGQGQVIKRQSLEGKSPVTPAVTPGFSVPPFPPPSIPTVSQALGSLNVPPPSFQYLPSIQQSPEVEQKLTKSFNSSGMQQNPEHMNAPQPVRNFTEQSQNNQNISNGNGHPSVTLPAALAASAASGVGRYSRLSQVSQPSHLTVDRSLTSKSHESIAKNLNAGLTSLKGNGTASSVRQYSEAYSGMPDFKLSNMENTESSYSSYLESEQSLPYHESSSYLMNPSADKRSCDNKEKRFESEKYVDVGKDAVRTDERRSRGRSDEQRRSELRTSDVGSSHSSSTSNGHIDDLFPTPDSGGKDLFTSEDDLFSEIFDPNVIGRSSLSASEGLFPEPPQRLSRGSSPSALKRSVSEDLFASGSAKRVRPQKSEESLNRSTSRRASVEMKPVEVVVVANGTPQSSATFNIYKCDFCRHTSDTVGGMDGHLVASKHLSGSEFGARYGENGRTELVYIAHVLAARNGQVSNKSLVIACPTCRCVFDDIFTCALHHRYEHGQNSGTQGNSATSRKNYEKFSSKPLKQSNDIDESSFGSSAYTLCPVISCETISLPYGESTDCGTCKQRFSSHSSLFSHWETNLSHLPAISQSDSKQIFVLSICTYCQHVFRDEFLECARHVQTHFSSTRTIGSRDRDLSPPRRTLTFDVKQVMMPLRKEELPCFDEKINSVGMRDEMLTLFRLQDVGNLNSDAVKLVRDRVTRLQGLMSSGVI